MDTPDRQTTQEELNRLLNDEELGRLQLTTLQYYLHESNPVNGLVRDKTHPRAPSSIAAVGLALVIVVYRHYRTTNDDQIDQLKG